MSDFERITLWQPAFDKRSPNPATNYGIHGMNLRFVLKGDEGAVQFLIFTNWHVKAVQDEHEHDSHHTLCRPMAADLGYHSPTPRYEGHSQYDCEFIEGGKCYYDGSSLNAEPVYWTFVESGEEAMWNRLAAYYALTFSAVPAS